MDYVSGERIDYPPTFQDPMIRPIAEHIKRGECVSVVGVGTMGKTWLIKRLGNTAVINTYYAGTGLSAENMLFVHVDPNANLFTQQDPNLAAWAGYELILSRLHNALVAIGSPRATEVGAAYNRILHDNQLYRVAAFRHLETALEALQVDYRAIIFVFDEFELLWGSFPASVFINLRALRDRFRYQLLYITMSRTELLRLPERIQPGASTNPAQSLESFLELFRDTVYMQPASSEMTTFQQQAGQPMNDLRLLTQHFNARIRQGARLPFSAAEVIWYMTGHHSGLIRTVLQVWNKIIDQLIGQPSADNIIQTCLDNPDILRELEILFESLTANEQSILQQYVTGQTPMKAFIEKYPDDVISLQLKSILVAPHGLDNQRVYVVTPPLLRAYLQDRSRYSAMRKRPTSSSPPPPDTLPETPGPRRPDDMI